MPAATSTLTACEVVQLVTPGALSRPSEPATEAPVSHRDVQQCASLLSRYLETVLAQDGPAPAPVPAKDQLRHEISHREGRIHELIAELDSEQSHLRDARACLEEKEQELDRRKRMYEDIKQRFTRQADDLTAALERTDHLWVALSELKEESDQLRRVVGSQEQDIKGREHAVQGFEETTRILRDTNTELEHELTRTRVELKEVRSQLCDKTDRLRSVEEECATLSKRVGDCVADPDAGMRLQRLAADFTEARIELRTVELERDSLRQERARMKAEARAAQEHVARLEVELQTRV